MNQTVLDNQMTYNIMKLNGKGQISVSPDLAVIRLGVALEGTSLSQLQEESAQIMQTIINSLYQFNISNLKTQQYNIEKIFTYENGVRMDRGYSVRNVLEFEVQDLSQVGPIIDTAVDNGSNLIELISFQVSDANTYYKKALNLAIQDTLEKANSIRKFLALPIAPIPIRIDETSTPTAPLQQISRDQTFATPIIPGNLIIEAYVTVDYLY